jgi:hypothetical protein
MSHFVVGLIVMDLFLWFVFHQAFHHFQFSGDTLTVKNSIMPTIHKEHLLIDIKNVYVDNVGHLGRALILEFTNGKKKAYGASDCPRDDMEEFAKYLNDQIKKSSR